MQARGYWVVDSNDSQTYHSQDSAILKKQVEENRLTSQTLKGRANPVLKNQIQIQSWIQGSAAISAVTSSWLLQYAPVQRYAFAFQG